MTVPGPQRVGLMTHCSARLLDYAYFGKSPPKSTGLEEFNLAWLTAPDALEHDAVDVQATLCELTARTIANDILRFAPATDEVYVCGGGAHNADLLARLARDCRKYVSTLRRQSV